MDLKGYGMPDEAKRSIRTGVLEDWERVADFNRRLAMETEGKELPEQTISAGVRAVLGDSDRGIYYCAIADGELVGQLMITREWSDWRNGWFHWIQSVYVEESFRGQGVFSSLYRHAEDIAKKDPEVCGLRLYVENDNTKAQEVYSRLGMSETHYLLFEIEF
ncbi:MAG: ribosomal protein S18 acetylase RimI-like enzyme [Limisphaerales bacterium]